MRFAWETPTGFIMYVDALEPPVGARLLHTPGVAAAMALPYAAAFLFCAPVAPVPPYWSSARAHKGFLSRTHLPAAALVQQTCGYKSGNFTRVFYLAQPVLSSLQPFLQDLMLAGSGMSMSVPSSSRVHV